MAKKNLSTGNFGVGTSWTPTVVNPAVQEWANKENTDWRLTPAARSKVAGGATKSTAVNRKPESSEEYTKRRIKEETQRTWRSDVADTLHGIGEGVLALHPYTAIPYYGAKVGQDVINGNLGWQTAINASIPLFHLSPQAVGLREATNVALEDAANAGSKTARNWRIAREINEGIKQNTKNGKIEVTKNYFNSPDRWYRVTETPEKFGIQELGKNITTRDNSSINGTIDSWRTSIIKNYIAEDGSHFKIMPGKGNNEGYFIKTPDKYRFSLSKQGAAHGNTSQAAKGQIWGGTFAYSGKFPKGILEGQAPSKIFRGMTETGKDSRTNFILQDWDNVPHGARVGFHTGEMPMSNLGWFQKTNKGTYTYEPIIPEKRITYHPILLLEPSTSLAFFERKPSRISFAERVGVPKGERDVWDPQVMLNAKEFANKYGYEVPLTIEEIKNMYRQHNRFFRSVETDRYEPKVGNTFFEYAPNYKPGMSEEEVIHGLYPEFKGLTPQQLRFTLASRGYPLYDRTYKISDIGKGPLDDFVFVSPSLAENAAYANSMGTNFSNTVMLQRPFSFGKPADWHINADWRPSEKVYKAHTKGQVSEGNSALKNEAKISTKHLIPVKIAEKGDLGTFLGDYLEKQKYKGSLPYEINIPINKQGGKMNVIEQFKQGSGIHIKKKNRGKFTAYCGGKVTDSCIRRAKASGNPTLVKRATFAANARKWKHQSGGTLQAGAELGSLLGDAMKKVTAQNNKKNDAFEWFKSRYLPINWNNMKYIYKQMKLAGIPYDTTIAVMGNIIHESQGDPKRRQIGGGPGYGLLLWNKGTEPGDTLELQTKGIINSIINPADLNNYWYHGGKGSGFNSGEDVRLYMNRKNNYEFSRKTKAFSDSLLRPGKPEMDDRIKSSKSLAAILDWFPEYLEGGKV